MTAQISDYCRFDNEIYEIVGKTDWFAFNPSVFGLTPGRCSTAVSKGYWSGYEIKNKMLFVEQLNIYTCDGIYPEVRGVKAVDPGYNEYITTDGKAFKLHKNYNCWIYDGFEYKFDYTGKYLLGKDRLQGAKYANRGGIDRFWKYKKLLSLDFCNGQLIDIEDVSYVGKQVWQMIEDNRAYAGHLDFVSEIQLENRAITWLDEEYWWCKRK